MEKVKTQAIMHLCVVLVALTICIVQVHGFYEEQFKKPIYLEAKVGSYVVFNCPLEYPQEIAIPYILHWNKDGRGVFSSYNGQLSASDLFVGRINILDTSQEVFGKASVNLTSIRESDAGWYECKVLFPNRSPAARNNGTWFHLAVEGGSLIKIPPINQTIMEGKTAFFHCVTKHPDSSHVTWYKDKKPLLEWFDITNRAIMGPDGSLSIDPTMMSDLGEYECQVKNFDGEEQSARAFLNIQYKAKVVYAPPEVYLPYGQPAILDCHFRSNPPLTNLRWEKDGILYDPYNVQGVFYKRNGSIFFNKVDETHAGRYSCTPYNDLGTDGPSPLINVIVQRPPIFTIKPKAIYIHKLGENAVLACEAADRDGNHRPTVQWARKDGTPLPYGRYSLEGGNITIENIVEADRGMYQCEATNEAATVTSDTELMIENVAPRAPYNLTANSSDTAITLRWQPGYIRSNVEFIVWYRLSEAAEWRTMRMTSKIVMEQTIPNLEPAREYEFMVLSQDQYGDGMFSKTYRYYTKPKEYIEPAEFKDPLVPFSQIGPPRNVTVQLVSDGYLVTWDPPEYGLDTLRLFVVRWYQEPFHRLFGSGETREQYYKVKTLEEDEIYTFQVTALSTTDYQSPSNEFEILVPPYRRMKALAIGATTGVIFLLIVLVVYVYVKRKCFNQYNESNEKIG